MVNHILKNQKHFDHIKQLKFYTANTLWKREDLRGSGLDHPCTLSPITLYLFHEIIYLFNYIILYYIIINTYRNYEILTSGLTGFCHVFLNSRKCGCLFKIDPSFRFLYYFTIFISIPKITLCIFKVIQFGSEGSEHWQAHWLCYLECYYYKACSLYFGSNNRRIVSPMKTLSS